MYNIFGVLKKLKIVYNLCIQWVKSLASNYISCLEYYFRTSVFCRCHFPADVTDYTFLRLQSGEFCFCWSV